MLLTVIHDKYTGEFVVLYQKRLNRYNFLRIITPFYIQYNKTRSSVTINVSENRMDNQEWTIMNGQSRMDNQEWAIKNGQSRDTGNIGNTRHRTKVCKTEMQHSTEN